jgi:hypothetical protein
MKTISSYLALLFFSAVLLASTCHEDANDPPPAKEIDSELLLNCWVHVYEENPDVYSQVYQVCELSEELPPSRFRATYTFLEDGICKYLALSPIDAHYTATGTWEFDKGNRQVKVYDENGDLVITMTIIEIGEERMVVSG